MARIKQFTDEEDPPQKRNRPKSLTDIQERVHAGARVRREFEATWRLCNSTVRGTHLGTSTRGNSNRYADVNKTKAIVDRITASLTTADPKLIVQARSEEEAPYADTAEAILNYWWQTHDFHNAIKLAQKDSIIVGHGWAKVEWRVEHETEPIPQEIVEARVGAEIARYLRQLEETPEIEPIYGNPDDIRTRIEKEAKQNPQLVHYEENPVVRRISPFDMYVDPEATSLNDASWICERIWEPLTEVRRNPLYKQTARNAVDVQGYSIGSEEAERGSDPRYRTARTETGDTSERALIYEYHDLLEGTWCRYASEATRYLQEPQPEPLKDSPIPHPYEMFRYSELPDDFYPAGEVQYLLGLQAEYNITRTDLLQHREQQSAKYLVNREMLTPDVQQKLQDPTPGVIVPLDLTQNNLANAVVALQQPPIAVDAYRVEDSIDRNMEDISASTEFDSGHSNADRRTATEANLIASAGTSRAALRKAETQKCAARIGQRILTLAQLYLQAEGVARITDELGGIRWATYSREKIQGQFDFSIKHGSMQPIDDNAQQQQALILAQTLSPLVKMNPQTGQPEPVVDPAMLATKILRAFGEDHPERFLTQPAQHDPYQQPITPPNETTTTGNSNQPQLPQPPQPPTAPQPPQPPQNPGPPQLPPPTPPPPPNPQPQ